MKIEVENGNSDNIHAIITLERSDNITSFDDVIIFLNGTSSIYTDESDFASVSTANSVQYIEVFHKDECIADYLYLPQEKSIDGIIYQGKIESVNQGVITGWARYVDKRKQPVLIGCFIDGIEYSVVQADIRRVDLLEKGFEYGKVGYRIDAHDMLCDGMIHEITIKTDEDIISRYSQYISNTALIGNIEAIKGYKISGWAINRLNHNNKLKIEIKTPKGVLGIKIADSDEYNDLTERYQSSGHSFSIDVAPYLDIEDESTDIEFIVAGQLSLGTKTIQHV